METFFRKYGVLCALLTISLTAFGQAGYIKAKAILAQYLLEDAWQQTLADGQPHKPWDWADTFPVAKLIVPGQNIEQLVLSGASGRNLAFGPGHLLSSSLPDQQGHIILGGHRDTHFEFLQYLKAGHEISIQDKNGITHRYIVTETEIHNIEVDQIRDRGIKQLTLITCYPFNTLEVGGPLRYLVHAEKI